MIVSLCIIGYILVGIILNFLLTVRLYEETLKTWKKALYESFSTPQDILASVLRTIIWPIIFVELVGKYIVVLILKMFD